MKIVVSNFQVLKVIDSESNEVEVEVLQGSPYWNIYCVIEALLYNHIKRLNIETSQFYDYYPYRKKFIAFYNSPSFIINMDTDIPTLLVIQES